MSNIVCLRRSQEPEHAPSPDVAIMQISAAVTAMRGQVSEEIRNAVLMLDLSVQLARLTIARLPDQQVQQRLTHQIETVERLLQVARRVTHRL